MIDGLLIYFAIWGVVFHGIYFYGWIQDRKDSSTLGGGREYHRTEYEQRSRWSD